MKASGFIIAATLLLSVNGMAQEAVVVPPVEETTATWQICNETSFILRYATAMSDGSVTHIDGWGRLRPSECISKTPEPKAARFLYAQSAPVHNGGIRVWDGQAPLCVNPDDDFNIDSTVSCALQGLETRGFLKIDPEETITKLIEPDNFGSKSETAGLQRLLQDAGYKINRVDGISGRRTRNTLRGFLKEHDVDSAATIYEQMEALAAVATGLQEIIGLNVCNDTESETWLAIGYREDGSWQSRGWWSIKAGSCIRPWSKNIQGTEMHIYAQKNGVGDDGEEVTSQVLKAPAGVASEFCIAEAKFSALGREFCTDQGYVSEGFRPMIADEKGVKITLTQSDFTASAATGLRQ